MVCREKKVLALMSHVSGFGVVVAVDGPGTPPLAPVGGFDNPLRRNPPFRNLRAKTFFLWFFIDRCR